MEGIADATEFHLALSFEPKMDDPKRHDVSALVEFTGDRFPVINWFEAKNSGNQGGLPEVESPGIRSQDDICQDLAQRDQTGMILIRRG